MANFQADRKIGEEKQCLEIRGLYHIYYSGLLLAFGGDVFLLELTEVDTGRTKMCEWM